MRTKYKLYTFVVIDCLLAIGVWLYGVGFWHHHIVEHIVTMTLVLTISTLTMTIVLAAVAAIFSRDRSPVRWFERILGGVFSFCNIFKP